MSVAESGADVGYSSWWPQTGDGPMAASFESVPGGRVGYTDRLEE